MRSRDTCWAECRGITDEMRRDAQEAYRHYGSIETIERVMRQAEGLPWVKSKANLARLSWLIKLKTLLSIEEGAYRDIQPKRSDVAPRVNGAFDIQDIPPLPEHL